MRKRRETGGRTAPAEKNNLFQKRQLQIVKKAAKLFTKKGYAQTSMREISKATGIDISNLYYFIESKEEILFRVFEMIHRPEIEVFEKQGTLSIEDPIEQLRTVIHEIMNFASDYREEILLLYRETKNLPKKFRKRILERESSFVMQIEEILKGGLEKKVFDFKDASFTANLLVYELALIPLRGWNLKNHTNEELRNLVEEHIMKTVMSG